MRIIDVHNHYYPPAYLDALEGGPSAVRVTRDDEGNPVLHYPGDYNVAVRGHRDLDYREQVLESVSHLAAAESPGAGTTSTSRC